MKTNLYRKEIPQPREILDIMEFRLGGLYLHEMRDLRGNGATLAEVLKSFQVCHKKGDITWAWF